MTRYEALRGLVVEWLDEEHLAMLDEVLDYAGLRREEEIARCRRQKALGMTFADQFRLLAP